MKVNVLGLVGAAIGVAAIFSVWVIELNGLVNLNLIDVLNDADVASNNLALSSAIFFIIGTLVAFLSPIGGILQIGGVLLWWNYMLGVHSGMPSSAVPASYVGLVSAIIVLASIVRPFGPGLMKGPFGLKNRLLIYGEGQSPEQKARVA